MVNKSLIGIIVGIVIIGLFFIIFFPNFISVKSLDILPSKYDINTKCQFVYALLENKYAGKEHFQDAELYPNLSNATNEIKKLVEKWGGAGYSGSWDNLPSGFWNEYYHVITTARFESMGVNPDLVDKVTDGTGAWLSERYFLSQEDINEDPVCAENIRKYYSDVVSLP